MHGNHQTPFFFTKVNNSLYVMSKTSVAYSYLFFISLKIEGNDYEKCVNMSQHSEIGILPVTARDF